MALNDDIGDRQVRHMIGIQRLSSSTVQKLIPILNQADRDIVEQLRRREAALEGSFTSQRLRDLLNSIREINRDAHVQLGRELRQDLRDLARYEADFQQRLLTNTIPIDFDVTKPSADMLDAVVHSRPFEGRLLREHVDELEAGTRRRLRDAIRQGMVQGEPVDDIVRRIRGTRAMNFRDGVMETSRRHAESLARTATNHTANAARERLFEENSDIVKSAVWLATLDTRVCLECASLDQREFEVGKGKRPPAHLNCRCTLTVRTKSWRELGIDADELEPSTRASMNGQVPSRQSFGDWLGKQSAEVQDEALGPTRGKLFREGNLGVDKFTNRRGDQWNLDELRRREEQAFENAGLAA